MKSPAPLLFIGLACLAVASCAWSGFGKKKPKPDDTAAKPVLVGRVASLPADRRFVLIQSYGAWNVATGSVLITRGPEARTANLLTTGETLGQFAAADLQSGTLEVGDAVFFTPPPIQKISPATPPTTPSPPQNPPKTQPAP